MKRIKKAFYLILSQKQNSIFIDDEKFPSEVVGFFFSRKPFFLSIASDRAINV